MNQDMLIHPGEVPKEEFLIPHGMNANQLATCLGVPANAITAIVNGTHGIAAPMSKPLGRAFGMSEDFFQPPDAPRDGLGSDRRCRLRRRIRSYAAPLRGLK